MLSRNLSAILVLGAFVAACNENGKPAGPLEGGVGDGSFGCDVGLLIEQRCATAGCHDAVTASVGLALVGDGFADALVGAPSGSCSGQVLIRPGTAEGSFLLAKLEDSPACGERMPIGAPLSDAEKACLASWVAQVAQNGSCETCGGEVCIDTQSSQLHCGSCDRACPSGTTCSAGECTCDGGGTVCGESCVDTRSDALHCGDCEKACPTLATCSGSSCQCPPGTEQCGADCVDTNSDPAHCNACDSACVGAQVCLNGGCQIGCGALTECDRACVDLTSDPLHCGDCAKACASGAECADGTCRCPDGQTECAGRCVDAQSDVDHCGSCGSACPTGIPCDQGTCACPNGGEVCAGACAETATDPRNCGGCGTDCGPGSSCVDGQCACSGSAPAFSEVESFLDRTCASNGCHSDPPGPKGGAEDLSLDTGLAYDELVGVVAAQCDDGRLLVDPGNPGSSYIIHKMTNQNLCAGTAMPKAGQTLPAADVELLANWICHGANR